MFSYIACAKVFFDSVFYWPGHNSAISSDKKATKLPWHCILGKIEELSFGFYKNNPQ